MSYEYDNYLTQHKNNVYKGYEWYKDAASEMAAFRDSFINAGFTRAEANEFIKQAFAGACKQVFGR